MQKITDQAWHFGVAAGIGALFIYGGTIGGALAGLMCGLIREFTEVGGSRIELPELRPLLTKRDFYIDCAFWALGGLVLALCERAFS